MRKQFIHLKRAWYAKQNLSLAKDSIADEVSIACVTEKGKCMGEFTVKWHTLHIGTPVPRLDVFNDAWKVLFKLPKFIKMLAKFDGKDISPEKFCEELKKLDFIDVTPEKAPPEYAEYKRCH